MPTEEPSKQKQSPLWAAEAVCGTGSLDRFYILDVVGLVPCYPVCPLLPDYNNIMSTVPHPRKECVKQQ